MVLPSGITSTGWPAVRDECAKFGVTFDDWQDGAGRALLAKRDDGQYACGIGGAVLSIPRQVGKTFLILSVVFALCLLNPNTTVLWTAHRLRTAEETFAKMQSFSRRKKIAPRVAKITVGSGEGAITFVNGSRILFGARERGFGRGFDDVDLEVFDEAQILTDNAIDDMVPAMNTAPNPLALFMGTPPKPDDPSEVFERKRAEALNGSDEDTLYVEFSADRDCDVLDRKQWKKANPSYPQRTPDTAMQRMKKMLTLESFIREGLGVWDENDGDGLLANWPDLHVEGSEVASNFAWGLVVTKVGRHTWSTIGFAGRRADGDYHVEVGGNWLGTDQIVERCVAVWGQERVPLRVHNAKDAIEAAFIGELVEAGVEVEKVNTTRLCHATTMLVEAVKNQTVRHLAQPELDAAVERAVLERSEFAPKHPGADVGPLKAVTVALGGVAQDADDGAPSPPMFAVT